MGRGFKSQPSVYRLSVAPTSRARCRGRCKQQIDKGEARLETCAFVRPGRRTVFVSHVHCISAALAREVLGLYGTVERVPISGGLRETAVESEVRALLEAHAKAQ